MSDSVFSPESGVPWYVAKSGHNFYRLNYINNGVILWEGSNDRDTWISISAYVEPDYTPAIVQAMALLREISDKLDALANIERSTERSEAWASGRNPDI